MQISARGVILAAVASLAMAGSAQATLIASESFAGSDFSANTGIGWAGGWNSSIAASQVTGLTNPYVASDGGAMHTTTQNFRLLSTTVSGDFYASVLINSAGSNFDGLAFYSEGITTENFGMGASWGGDSLSPFIGSWVEKKSGGHGFVGSSIPLDSSTHLLVAHVTNFVNGQNATVSVYVDPDLSGGVLPGIPSYSFVLDSSVQPISAVRVEQSGSASLDEIRIGTELSDVVTVVPEPASLGLLGLASTLLLRRRMAR